MITKMRKLSFLVFHQEYETFLQEIRQLGVIHVQMRQEGLMTPQLEQFLERKALLKEAIREMTAVLGEHKPEASLEEDLSSDQIISGFRSFTERAAELQHQIPLLDKDIQDLRPWGEFSWDSIHRLEEAGYMVSFFSCTDREYNAQWERDFDLLEVDRAPGGRISFLVVSREPVYLGIEKVSLPEVSLSELESRRSQILESLRTVDAERLAFCMRYLSSLERSERLIDGEIDLMKVRLQGEAMAEGSVIVMDGWIPADLQQPVTEYLDRSCAYYEIRDAVPGDDVPIKLRNNSFVRAYETLTNMYGLPSYSEFDPTPLIAPFFSLFFAFCLGDSGYGIVLIALGLWLKKKVKSDLKPMMNLVIFLGISTMVFGAILGTFFGINLFESTLVPDTLKRFMLSGKFGDTTYDVQMVLSLAIGVFHTIVAMTVKAIKQTVLFGFKNALKEWGWLILVGGFTVIGTLSAASVISGNVTQWAFIIVGGIAAVGIYLLNNIRRNPLVNIGSGLWDTYQMASGLLGDTLSYVRLYALGLAGGMLGGIFNTLALSAADGLGGIGGWLFCGVIMIFGHALNIAMSCISAFVHPLRLNFVEYFKNSGYEGTGRVYKPFAEVAEK